MISFIKGSEYRQISRNQEKFQNKRPNGKLIYLLDPSYDFKIFELIPRTFTIIRGDKSYKFNVKLLKDVSPVIRDLLKKDPKARQFKFDAYDFDDCLSVIEQLFQGKMVFFNKYHLSFIRDFTEKLQITRCPKYMKRSNEFTDPISEDKELYLFNGVVMNPNYDFFLSNKIPKSFTIITKTKEYKCNKYGIYSSKLIRDLLKENPNLKQYKYDFDDEFNEFQQICDLFNFQKMTITPDNMDVIKEISEHFQIDVILPSVNKFIEKQEKVSQKIDDDQNSVDLIDELFEWLYNIKDLTVENVKSSILDSNWSKSEDEIHELVAFILQVLNNNISIHNQLIELVISLDDELKTLIPFLNEMLMDSLGNSINNCAFVYKMLKKGKIQKELLEKTLTTKMYNHSYYVINNLISWFLPELIEFKLFDERKIQKNSVSEYIFTFLPDKIDLYKTIRDSDEPENLITKSIRNDDVDTFQSIITQNEQIKDLSKYYIQYNIFDTFPLSKINYLDYSAACGSIKCFKYLLLNHQDITQSTFNYAIIGGNIEIIKIIDQKLDFDDNNNSNLKSKIIPLIEKHRNDIFDWIFEQKFQKNDINNSLINELAACSIKNGNIHCLIEFIDKGYNLRSNAKTLDILNLAAQNGFYKFLCFLHHIIGKDVVSTVIYNSLIYNYIAFDNISIYKSLLEYPDINITDIISHAVLYDKRNLIDFFFNEQVKNGQEITSDTINQFLLSSLKNKSDDLFNYVTDKFKTFCKDEFEKFQWNIELLEKASLNNNCNSFYTIIKLLPKSENKYNFSNCFINAIQSDSLEICKYLIDNKLFTDFEILLPRSKTLSSKSKDILTLVIENINPQLKETLFESLLFPAIENHNFELVEYLFKEGIFFDDVLFHAVFNNDEKIVKLILKYKNDPEFINKGSRKGTPLNIAVQNRYYPIIKILLSTPSIDPYLFDVNNRTPLMKSIDSNNYEIINEILSFYGDKIFDYKDQIDYILNQLSSNFKSNEQIKIFERLISSSRFADILDARNQMFLINICSIKSYLNIVKLLLKIKNINFNVYSPSNGDTPLITAIKYKNDEIAELLINDPRTNINLKNYDKQCALTVAIQKKLISIVELLINNQTFDPKENLVNYSFIISDVNISRILLSYKHIDVNYKFYENRISYKTALLQAVENDDKEKIDLIIKHPEFDKEKSLFKNAIKLSITSRKNECLTKLIDLLSIKEINELQIDGDNITELLVMYQNDVLLEKLVQKQDFVIPDDVLTKCMINIFNITSKSFQLMEIIVDYDKKHNKIIDFSKISYLTAFNERQTYYQQQQLTKVYEDIIDFISKNTKDIDIINAHNIHFIYPFQRAILMESEEYATALINTNKLIFNMKIFQDRDMKDYTSYFHLAAMSSNSKILKLLIDKNILNESTINYVDSDGNSILMKASENLRLENVELICKFKQCAYWIKNKNNEDVLDIVQNKIINRNKKKSKTDLFQMNRNISYGDSFKKHLIALINEALGNIIDYDRDDYNQNYNYDNDANANDNANEDEYKEEEDNDDIPITNEVKSESSQFSSPLQWRQALYMSNWGIINQENKPIYSNIPNNLNTKSGEKNQSTSKYPSQSKQSKSLELRPNSMASTSSTSNQENKLNDSNKNKAKTESSSSFTKASQLTQEKIISYKNKWNYNSSGIGWGSTKQTNTTPNLNDSNNSDTTKKSKTENLSESKIISSQDTKLFYKQQHKDSNNSKDTSKELNNTKKEETNNNTTDKTKTTYSSFQKASQLTGWGSTKQTNTTPNLNDSNNNDTTNKTKTENSPESRITLIQNSIHWQQHKDSNNSWINSKDTSKELNNTKKEETNNNTTDKTKTTYSSFQKASQLTGWGLTKQTNTTHNLNDSNNNDKTNISKYDDELNDVFDDFELDFYYDDYHNKINQNLIYQQFNFLMQCNTIRESQFNVLMNLNMELLKKSRKKSKKKH